MEYALDQFERETRATLLATGRVPADAIELATPNPRVPADLTFPIFRLAQCLGWPPGRQRCGALAPASSRRRPERW